MRIRPRNFFDDESLQNALKEYRVTCCAMLDPAQSYEMLRRYEETLRRDLDYAKAKQIPEEFRVEKWKFMLAYADAAYHIDIGDLKGTSLGEIT